MTRHGYQVPAQLVYYDFAWIDPVEFAFNFLGKIPPDTKYKD